MERRFSNLWCIEYLNADGEWTVTRYPDEPERPLVYFYRGQARASLSECKYNNPSIPRWRIQKIQYPDVTGVVK